MDRVVLVQGIEFNFNLVYISLTVISSRSICNLYNWRYKKLGNLPHVINSREYKLANAGFYYDFQLVNVADFNGVGESEPSPYFYQVCNFFIKIL
jgi:hypothetical protein